MKQRTVRLKDHPVTLSNAHPLVLIAGLCVIEDERRTLAAASALKKAAAKLGVPLVFKASYDKANRSSGVAYRGPGRREGLRVLASVRKALKLPVLTDVHETGEVNAAAEAVDILQVPAFLCRQTDLLAACARTGLPVNVKKGQFLAPEDTANIVGKLERAGSRSILLTERGASFGYHNLVVDMRSLEIMKRSGYPVIFDATHSVQLPGGRGTSTGGQREFIAPLSRAAAAVGIAGIFIEVHPRPEQALSDGPNSLALSSVVEYMKPLLALDRIAKRLSPGGIHS